MTKPNPYTLHFAPTPNGKKITVFFEEARIPYKIMTMDLSAGDQMKPAFLKISPNNKMPALIDPDGPSGKPFSVFESGAILLYLGRKTGAFYPLTGSERSRVEQWLFFQMASLGPMSGQAYYYKKLAKSEPVTADHGLERYTKEVRRLYRVMDRHLAGRDWFADQISIADFAIYPWIFRRLPGQDVWDECKNLQAWHTRMGARAGVQRGMAVGESQT